MSYFFSGCMCSCHCQEAGTAGYREEKRGTQIQGISLTLFILQPESFSVSTPTPKHKSLICMALQSDQTGNSSL